MQQILRLENKHYVPEICILQCKCAPDDSSKCFTLRGFGLPYAKLSTYGK